MELARTMGGQTCEAMQPLGCAIAQQSDTVRARIQAYQVYAAAIVLLCQQGRLDGKIRVSPAQALAPLARDMDLGVHARFRALRVACRVCVSASRQSAPSCLYHLGLIGSTCSRRVCPRGRHADACTAGLLSH